MFVAACQLHGPAIILITCISNFSRLHVVFYGIVHTLGIRTCACVCDVQGWFVTSNFYQCIVHTCSKVIIV